MAEARFFCSELSREEQEPLAATASRIDHWLLVEYRGLWGPDAVRASGLSDQVKAALREQVRAQRHTRLLFIRRPDRRGRRDLRAYGATSLEGEEALRGHSFETYDDLRGIDLLRGGTAIRDPLFLVCTHGKHDPCCARHGRPLFEAIAEQLEEDWVWQSTHVGGDRFAGNVVFLPEGLYFGHLERADVWPLLDDYLSGQISLDRYRGRSCYPFHVQAAEAEVRTATGLTGIDDLTLLASERTGEGTWTVTFAAEPTGDVHEVDVAAHLGEPTHLTCGATTPQRPRRFAATEHRVRARL